MHARTTEFADGRLRGTSINDTRPGVTVIGLGPMGQSMARCFLRSGHPVTVWNRTMSRGDALVALGAARAHTVSEALTANELVILSLTDYQAMYHVLNVAPGSLQGRVIVNLSSDTPRQSREAAAWLAERGAELLVGGLMVPEDLVGTEHAYVFYSGPRALYEAHRETLEVIGRADYRGEDHGLAQLFYQAQLDIFLTALSAYLHATALVGSADISAQTFLPYAIETFDSLSSFLTDAGREIDEGHYPGEAASVAMMGATADHIVGSSHDAGIDLELPRAVKAHYDRALAGGRGRNGWTSLIEGIRNPRQFQAFEDADPAASGSVGRRGHSGWSDA